MAILITGASAGFGVAMCRAFVQAGYPVIGAARRADKLAALQNELARVIFLSGLVGRIEAAQEMS